MVTTVNKSRRKLEQIASAAPASHIATTSRTRGAVLLVSSLKVKFPYGLAEGLCVAPAQGFRAYHCVCHRFNHRRWETERSPRPIGALHRFTMANTLKRLDARPFT